jgi:uncharacterized protein YciI
MSAQEGRIRYVVVHLPGPRWRAGVVFQEQPGVQAHVQHYRQLHESGKLEKGGPFVEGALGGMMIPVAEMTREEILRFAAQDPAVKAGLLNFELWSWYVVMERG